MTGHTCWGKVVDALGIFQHVSAKLKEKIFIIVQTEKKFKRSLMMIN